MRRRRDVGGGGGGWRWEVGWRRWEGKRRR